jgi:glycyl-tRNA synthetase beta chain
MVEFLLELLSEEIPARMQTRAAEDLKRLVCDGLKAMGLEFSEARAFATPRRLALVVDGLPMVRADVSEEKRGPRVGAPEHAVQGFLKSAGLVSLEQAEKRDTGKGEFWFAIIRKRGGPTAEALPAIVVAAMEALPWPKSMRWGSGTMTWVRPLQSIVALFDGKVLRGDVQLGGMMGSIKFGDTTLGHRFLSNGPIKVSGYADYVAKLRAGHVILDTEDRKKIIFDGAQRLCAEAQVFLEGDKELLDEVAGLVEWPVPLMGEIDDEFLSVPHRILISSMRTHQRYFPTWKSNALANRFVVIANHVASDAGEAIVEGNERVLRARLADAKYFWDQDLKVRLEERLPVLRNIIFHAKLGSVAERVDRLTNLAGTIAKLIGANTDQIEQAKQAARLSKADLVSGVVGEFPELQGVMGRLFALVERLPMPVADAIGNQYAPAGPRDDCPSEMVSVAVSLTDKLEALFGFWRVNERPTGSRDPFGLRRAAIGIVRLIIENELRVPLRLALFEVGDAFIEPEIQSRRSELAAKLLTDFEAAREMLVEAEAYRQIQIPIFHALQSRKIQLERPPDITEAEADDIADIYVAQWSKAERQHLKIIADDVLAFVVERLKIQMREKGIRHDVVDAVFALGGEDDLVRLLARVEAVQSFLGTEAGKNLLTAYGRAANIVRVEERKDRTLTVQIADRPKVALLKQDEEIDLYKRLDALPLADRIKEEDFVGAMKDLASLREPIDAFFEKVTVNVTDSHQLRVNRLKLLNQIRATMDSVADFSRIEG